MEAVETATTENDSTIVVFQDDGTEGNGHLLTHDQFPTVHATVDTNQDTATETILVPESYIPQDSILGTDVFIRCTPCNKIFISANGYNTHVQVRIKMLLLKHYYFLFLVIFSFKNILQNKECADENNTDLFEEVSHEASLTIQDTGESNGLENHAGN